MSIGTDVMFCNEYDNFTVELGATVGRGDVVHVASDGKAYKACAATGGTNKQPAVGIAETAGVAGDWITVQHRGKVAVTGLTPGSTVFLSDTAGKFSHTPGTNPQILGIAVKDNEWVLGVDLQYGTAGADAYYKPDDGIPETDLADAVVTKLDAGDTAYQLPETGIPETDLATAVQTSLGKADNAMPAAGGTFTDDVTLDDGVNVILDDTTGSKFGTEATQKMGFYGATPVVQPSGAAQAVVTPGNENGEIAGLTFSATVTQGECEALRDKCEELADDLRATVALVNKLRADLLALGFIKGEA